MNLARIAALVIAGCLLASCKTVPSASAQSAIQIPGGVSVQETKYAIIAALYADPPRPLSVNQEITDNALRALFPLTYRRVNDRRGGWFLEDIRPSSVLAGFDDGTHYLRVEYLIAGGTVTGRVDGSRNLKQTETSIHKAALEWMGRLESRIRANLGIVAGTRVSPQKDVVPTPT